MSARWLRRSVTDIFEGVASIVAQPRLLVGSALAAGLGLGLFVATVTVSITAERQVAASFDVLRATTVEVESIAPEGPANWVPLNYAERLSQVAGVVTVDRVVSFGDVEIATAPPTKRSIATVRTSSVVGLDIGSLRPFGGLLVGSAFEDDAPAIFPSVLLGRKLAADLGISMIDGVQAVWIDGHPFVVRGILLDVARRPDMLDSAMVAVDHAANLLGPPQRVELVLETLPGAARSVSAQAPLALRPDDPSSIVASAPPDPDQFRGTIEQQVASALLLVSGIAVLVAAAGIANTMGGAVLSRVGELGLRRAIGARPMDIFIQILTEAIIIGLSGGLIGVSIGVSAAIGAARWMGWNPVISPVILLFGAFSGVVLGAFSGVVPALKASRIQPVDALRAGE